MDMTCDQKNAFDGDPTKQAFIGGLTTLSIGTETLVVLKAKAAVDAGQTTSVVAVLTHFTWGGQPTDPIILDGLTNDKGRAALERVMDASKQLDVKFGIKICRPSADTREYYAALDASSLKGILDKNSGKGALFVEHEKDPQSHGGTEEMYGFHLEVAADVSSAQAVAYATEKGAPTQKFWGQKG